MKVAARDVSVESRGFLASLGIYTKFASASEIDPLLARFYLQSLAREIAPKSHRVGVCLRQIAPNRSVVDIRLSDSGKASYANLMTCGRVWVCPVCAARITEQRRVDLGAALAEWKRQGYQVAMLTYTLSHGRQTALKTVLETLKAARRRFKSGRLWQFLKASYKIAGTISATEVTWGSNGWHPHAHELLFFKTSHDDSSLFLLQNNLQEKWLTALAKQGGGGIKDIALKLSASGVEIAAYVAKFGLEVVKKSGWGIEHEMTKNPTKRGNDSDHATPTELLIAYGNGSRVARQLWLDYIVAFRGKQQLVWSKGLKALLKADLLADDEIVSQEDDPANTLASIDSRTWQRLLAYDGRNGLRGRLLKAAQVGGVVAVHQLILDTLGDCGG